MSELSELNKGLTHGHGGLMAKSIGPIYPLSVSARGNIHGEVGVDWWWYIWDTLDGWESHVKHTSSVEAHEYAEWFLANIISNRRRKLGIEE